MIKSHLESFPRHKGRHGQKGGSSPSEFSNVKPQQIPWDKYKIVRKGGGDERFADYSLMGKNSKTGRWEKVVSGSTETINELLSKNYRIDPKTVPMEHRDYTGKLIKK